MTNLSDAIDRAESFHSAMTAELAALSAEAEETGEYAAYDMRAADLREIAEQHLESIIRAYRNA